VIITISASPGAGKRMIARLMSERLGFRCVTIPDLRRSLARDHDVSDAELLAAGESDYWTDGQVDEHLEEMSASFENLIIASRFGFMLVPHSFKIMLVCDPIVSAHRLRSLGEDRYGLSIDEVVFSINERIAADRERGMRFYDTDPHDPSHFDLVLDTSRLTPEQTVDMLTSGIACLKESWSDRPEHI
jgi:CMP/dCMP kinase